MSASNYTQRPMSAEEQRREALRRQEILNRMYQSTEQTQQPPQKLTPMQFMLQLLRGQGPGAK